MCRISSSNNGRWWEELEWSVMAFTFVSVTLKLLKFVLVLTDRE